VVCLCVTRTLAVLRNAGGEPAVVVGDQADQGSFAPVGAVLRQLPGEDELERARR